MRQKIENKEGNNEIQEFIHIHSFQELSTAFIKLSSFILFGLGKCSAHPLLSFVTQRAAARPQPQKGMQIRNKIWLRHGLDMAIQIATDSQLGYRQQRQLEISWASHIISSGNSSGDCLKDLILKQKNKESDGKLGESDKTTRCHKDATKCHNAALSITLWGGPPRDQKVAPTGPAK